VSRLALLGIVVALIAAGCGGQSTYSADKTRACLASESTRIGGPLDFVATTATGGAFVAHLSDNSVTIAFGKKQTDATDIASAYQRFAFPNVRSNIQDVLQLYRNAVLLWQTHPASADLALVTGCLK
jgi:ABC-type glycerol-3-phosphate transport system substrate-binding protein